MIRLHDKPQVLLDTGEVVNISLMVKEDWRDITLQYNIAHNRADGGTNFADHAEVSRGGKNAPESNSDKRISTWYRGL